MELRDYLHVLRKNWILVAVCAVVGTAVGIAYALLATPAYTASAKVFVSTSGAESASDLQQGNSFTTQRVNTYIDLVNTTAVLRPTAEALGITVSSSGLRELITASAPVNTSVINITATHADPVFAASVATQTATALIDVVEDVESSDQDGTSPISLSLVEEAEVPGSPTSPNRPLAIALGCALGVALGIGGALVRQAADNRVHGERDVEALTDVPIVGGIVFDPKARERALVVHADPRSPRAESFRTMRSNIQFLDTERHRSFVITSALPGEGKTTTAANLALALADSGASVMLVGADLRKPRIAGYMGIEGTVGLTDVLVKRVTLEDATQRWGETALDILPSGAIPPNPSELLGSASMAALVETLQARYDVVLFDGAPLLPVTDSAILARSVGGAIVLCQAGKTRAQQLRGALGALDNVGAHASGIALTMLPTKGPDAYGYGRYGYVYSERDA
ncbi:polysaccharide biosynthesis tyrosine autokinase [Demequina globuliformis]|uniref:polysaccharide biosynthesis tyrosine autokinase n=1 Tax=Demequina globuliformis TaxID=676202 RepID=UPI000780A756|nr:polysaccharide biosynthesis tyrosine autokinase [Demequina globuliformis]